MQLHVTQWGSDDADVLLLHGMLASGGSWWRVAQLIADRGHGVVALDLPGHGRSPAHPSLTIDHVAASVIETWASVSPAPPALVIGHSFGGLVLAAAVDALRPARAIYVDAPTRARGGWDREVVRTGYEADKAARTYQGLRSNKPHYTEQDCQVEADAADRFDVETAVELAASAGGSWTPAAPLLSMMIRANPSDYISDEDAAILEGRGVQVHDVEGAAHTVWYSHFDAFMKSIDDWY